MHPGPGEQRRHLVEDVLQEGEGAFVARAIDILKHPPLRHARERPAGAGEVGEDVQRGGGVARHLDLRHHGDEALGGVGDDLADLVPAVETAVARAPLVAESALGGQLGVFPDLQAPGLVVGQVPVEAVQLVQRHAVEARLDERGRKIVAAAVEHEAAPGEARPVHDVQAGQRHAASPPGCRFPGGRAPVGAASACRKKARPAGRRAARPRRRVMRKA